MLQSAARTGVKSRGTQRPATIRVDDALAKLQTREGQKMVGALMEKVRPSIASEGLLEPLFSDEGLPGDHFERGVVRELHNHFIRSSEAKLYIPSAVGQLLADLADGGGKVSFKQISQTLGPAGVQFFKQLQGIKPPAVAQQLDDRRNLDRLSNSALAAVARTGGVAAPELPSLQTMIDEIAKPDEFEGFKFLGLQHLFMSTASLFDGLNQVGVDHGDMRVIGKIYSTNFACAALLESKGATVDGVSRRIVSSRPFEQEMEDSISWQLRQIIETLPRPPEKNPKSKVLLIDDGAEAIKLLHDEFPEYAPYFVCVEQTRRGARIIHELEEKGALKCPVANVAETWGKLEWESPMIGHSVVLETKQKLDQLEAYGVHTGKEALVMGYGAIGQAVAKSLQERGFEVHVYDPDPEKRSRIPPDMIAHADMAEALPHGQTLVSCVGKRTLSESDHDLLPDGAILVNAASADDELGPEDLIPFSAKDGMLDEDGNAWGSFQGKPVCLGMSEATAHSDWVIRKPSGKELYLVNKGFVVNMTGERDAIPPRYIQLTRSLLFLGALAAHRSEKAGIVDVPMDWQKRLVDVVGAQLEETGESLLDPDWEKHDGRPEIHAQPASGHLAVELTHVNAEAEAKAHGELEEKRVRALAAYHAKARVGGADLISRIKQSTGKRTYGYKLGPVQPDTREAAVAGLLGDNSGELTVETAAIHAAVSLVNHRFNTSLRLRSSGEGEAAIAAKVYDSGAEPEARFESAFAHYLLALTKNHLDQHAGKPVRPEFLCRHLAGMLLRSEVPANKVIDVLRASDDPQTRKIAQMIYRRLSKTS